MRRVLLAAALVAAVSACGPAVTPPDVVVVVIDTLRPDHLGFHGYDRETAPFLAELASRSMVFRRAFSTSSWTAPSTASIFTAQYPTQHGIVTGFFAHKARANQAEAEGTTTVALNRFADETVTLPEAFSRAGYRTFGLAANINVGPEMGFDRGFDHFERMVGENLADLVPGQALADRLREWRSLMRPGVPDFVYLHFMDPHAPYNEQAPWYRDDPEARHATVPAYDSEIGYVDDVIGRLYAEMEWDRDTIVFVVSDHGEEFLEHGQLGHNPSLYRELVQVLFMVSGPDLETGELPLNVSLVDVLPTVADLAGVPVPEGVEGTSLAPLLRADRGDAALRRELADRVLFAHRTRYADAERQLWAAIHHDWTLIQKPARLELYDFVKDPWQRENRLRDEPDKAPLLMDALQAFQERERGAGGGTVGVELDEETLEALKELGYVR